MPLPCLICVLAAMSAQDRPTYSTAQLVELTQRVREHQTALDRVLENYTYTETVFDSKIDKNGAESSPASETFERSRVTALDRRLHGRDAGGGLIHEVPDEVGDEARVLRARHLAEPFDGLPGQHHRARVAGRMGSRARSAPASRSRRGGCPDRGDSRRVAAWPRSR